MIKNSPQLIKFYSSLKLQNICEEEYEKTLEIYKKLKCKKYKRIFRYLHDSRCLSSN